jgi:dTMP kinase
MNHDLSKLAAKLRGKFLVFDGPDGAGKSTQLGVLAERLTAAGADLMTCHDPGGTEIGERIRSVLLDHDLSTMDVRCEALLFMASRAQLVSEVIRPALKAGKIVLCDRFVTATCAYQGAAGFDPRRVVELARITVEDCWPDLTLVLDVGPEEAAGRIGHRHDAKGDRSGRAATPAGRSSRPDAMETRPADFHQRVREIFLDIQKYYPRPVITVDGHGARDEVHQRIVAELNRVAW